MMTVATYTCDQCGAETYQPVRFFPLLSPPWGKPLTEHYFIIIYIFKQLSRKNKVFKRQLFPLQRHGGSYSLNFTSSFLLYT